MARPLVHQETESEIGPLADDVFVEPEEGRQMFDKAVRDSLGISGEEFISRWEAGEYWGVADQEGSRYIGDLIMLIPFARQNG